MSTANQTRGRRSELALRFLSAGVLIPLGLYAVWTGGWALAAGAAIFAAAMAFEWGRMTRSRVTFFAMGAAAVINAAYPVLDANAAYVLGGAALGVALLERGEEGRGAAAFGLVYAGGMALALQALRAFPNVGWELALGGMLIVWASDSAAYFVGRAVGGPRISPQDSPNKTWSGAAGATVASVAAAVAFGGLIGASFLAWAGWGLLISVAAQAGDMFESQIKRRYGVKDTSGLVPGHGGVLDRVDGLGAACVAAIAVLSLAPQVSGNLGSVA